VCWLLDRVGQKGLILKQLFTAEAFELRMLGA
jgi:hypothetical protein